MYIGGLEFLGIFYLFIKIKLAYFPVNLHERVVVMLHISPLGTWLVILLAYCVTAHITSYCDKLFFQTLIMMCVL